MTEKLEPLDATSELSPLRAAAGTTAARTNQTLPIWTVYQSPRDFPGKFIARLFVISRGYPAPTTLAVVGDNLDDVRRCISAGLFRTVRWKDDDPCIVETWI